MDINIEGKLVGQERLIRMINRAPGIYIRSIKTWLLRESAMFVGNSKRDGAFRKKLMKKRTLKGNTWSPKVVKLFKGKLSNEDKIEMKMTMGLLYTNKRKIHEILEYLSEGGRVTNNSYMPVPVYRNLDGISKPYGLYKRLKAKDELTVIYKNDRAYYFDKKSHGKLLFVGSKNVYIKSQFNFYAEWEKRVPAVLERSKKAIDRATIKVEKQG